MSELRKDPIVDRWVILSTDPLRSPDLSNKRAELRLDEGPCPFCPGNEQFCPPDILTNRNDGASGTGWNLRVIPNRSPLLVVEEDLIRMGEGLYDKITGIGANEVIIETPKHEIRQSEMSRFELENLIWAYRDRMIDLRKDRRLRYVHAYKNQGFMAGATLDHPYSLLVGLPIVPSGIIEKLKGAKKHFDYKERCIYCDIIRQEILHEARIVAETKHFVAFETFAPRVPFETWVLPKRHTSKFIEIEPAEIVDFALIFKDVISRIDAALDRPAYNYGIHTAPSEYPCEKYFHWHMKIFPRITQLTGFEWGADLYINPTPPEEAARFLRRINTP